MDSKLIVINISKCKLRSNYIEQWCKGHANEDILIRLISQYTYWRLQLYAYLCGITSITFSSIIIHANRFNWSQRSTHLTNPLRAHDFTSKFAPWPLLIRPGRIIAICVVKIIVRWVPLQTVVAWERKQKDDEKWDEASF